MKSSSSSSSSNAAFFFSFFVLFLLSTSCQASIATTTKPCEDCVFKGTAKLKVLGTTNHETISLKFNETGQVLYCSGSGDTSHTITFPYCGPLKYDVVTYAAGQRRSVSLVLDPSWKDSICARHHHLPSKMRKLSMQYEQEEAKDGDVEVTRMKMTAEVYTVWPLGWLKTTWILDKQDQPSA